MVSGQLPITEKLIDIVDSCTLCGVCNLQCYFQVELTPRKVMVAMKKILKERLQHESVQPAVSNEIIDGLRKVVGDRWASNDPAILTSYAAFGSLSSQEKIPDYVVLPENAQETARVVQFANTHHLPFLPISSGTNIALLARNDGILIDMNRMKTLRIDPFNYCAEVGAGVLAYDLQKEAMPHGLRMSIGEGAAGVCANQVSTGVHSLFSYQTGMMADNYLEAELVTPQGEIISTTSAASPNIVNSADYQFKPEIPYICTKLRIKLHEVEKNETVIYMPFRKLPQALAVMKQISKKNIGIGMGLISIGCLKSFLSLTLEDEENFMDIAQEYLKMNYGIMMMLNQEDLDILKSLFDEVIILSQETIQKIIQGIPAITGPECMFLIESIMDEQEPYKQLFGDMLDYFLKQIAISPQEVSEIMSHIDDRQLRKSLCELYFKPEFSDIKYWFNYRMFAPRMTRKQWFFPILLYCTYENPDLIDRICAKFKSYGEKFGVENALCYVTPIDKGKRVFLEYDYYYDQNDSDMLQRLKKMIFALNHEIEKMEKSEKGIYPVIHTNYRGLGQKDLYIYNQPPAQCLDDGQTIPCPHNDRPLSHAKAAGSQQ